MHAEQVYADVRENSDVDQDVREDMQRIARQMAVLPDD
jgi:hypothetical protein